MKFNEAVIQIKHQEIALAESREDLARAVMAEILEVEGLDLERIEPRWRPGGGAVFFCIRREGRPRLVLKMKSLRLSVESRLEGETEFTRTPSIRHEQEILGRLHDVPVPLSLGYVERDGFGFHLMEWHPALSSKLPDLTVPELQAAFDSVRRAVRALYEQGMAHTDLHEENILLDGEGRALLIDFEEAKWVEQDAIFEESLDVTGATDLGDTGFVPAELDAWQVGGWWERLVEALPRLGGPRRVLRGADLLAGPTIRYCCLNRLEKLTWHWMRKRVVAMIRAANWDDSSPYNLDELQEPNDKHYQSIRVPGIRLEGQRPLKDERLDQMVDVVRELGSDGLRCLDIGCNLGMLTLRLAEESSVAEAVGVEADERVMDCAHALAIYAQCGKARFVRAVCGEDDLCAMLSGRFDVTTVLSIYHHIPNREDFVSQLGRICQGLCVIEPATQERYYPQRGDFRSEMEWVRQGAEFRTLRVIGESRDFRRPIFLLEK
jgi:2-polyprenyl-3-methyl-5-hydroxy-6-metoxy-1,4-benzoquinol methylase